MQRFMTNEFPVLREEPARLERQRTGVFVLLFLIILGSFTYLLNREYWKDVDH